MRRPRGQINQLEGYFHVENSLRPDVDPFSEMDMALFRHIMLEELHAAGLVPVLDQFHPRGFGLLLRKPPASASQQKTPEQQPSACIKSFKQRISRQYNRSCGHRGTIWQDRTKLFYIPDTAKDRTDVAAYILARPQIECGGAATEAPATRIEARNGDPAACAAIAQIFSSEQYSTTLLKKLETRRDDILRQSAQPRKLRGRRGRVAEWRPDCEQGGEAQALVPPPEPRGYMKRKKQAKRRFFKMLERYKAFCERTGYDYVPRGYAGEQELRCWAAQRRGEFRRGRLPAWQIEPLQKTRILEPLPGAGTPTAPSAAWMRQYRMLKHFFDKHGHSRTTPANCPDRSLLNWVRTQRSLAAKAVLHTDKELLLDALDFFRDRPSKVEEEEDEWRLPTHLL